MIDKPFVLMPPVSPQWAVAECLMWREWTVEEAAEGMDEAEREMRKIIKLMQNGEPNE